MKLIIATRNMHKLQELRAMLRVPELTVQSAFDFPDIPDVVEDGSTFEENAVKKARTLCEATACWTLADDSGLVVDALGGAPGIFSARYAGEPTDNQANNEKLLRELRDIPDRTARFVCVMALAAPDGAIRLARGECEGSIARECRGTCGFGYDPLFLPNGHDKTFGELGEEAKSGISHRALAMRKALHDWRPILLEAAAR